VDSAAEGALITYNMVSQRHNGVQTNPPLLAGSVDISDIFFLETLKIRRILRMLICPMEL
jgi:hypothetical protein